MLHANARVSMMRGGDNNIPIKSRNTTYFVYRSVLVGGLLPGVQIPERIEPSVDGIVYGGDDESTGTIVYFIHQGALQDILVPQPSAELNMDQMHLLPRALSTIMWCKNNVRPSPTFDNYVGAVVRSIKNAVQICRALLSDDSTILGGHSARLDILHRAGFGPIEMPPYLGQWILLPTPFSGSADSTTEHCDGGNSLVTTRDTEGATKGHIRVHKTVDMSGVRAMQERFREDYTKPWRLLIARDNANYLRIPNCGPEFARMVRELVPNHDDLTIPCCGALGELSIVRVFHSGVGAFAK